MEEEKSSEENSDGELQIVIESPKQRKTRKADLNESDKKIIEAVEKDLEENLEEKAVKANLTAKNVKSLIKEVVTNEHVIALLKHAEDPDKNEELITTYEPKFTRAKTKELLSGAPQPKILPWIKPPKKVSEVHKLFTEELQEDDSGDEYVPKCSSQNTSFDESQLDVSQISPQTIEEANIARRTRSKLCLSHTPLEVIEEAFMPPDITTDMYDMDCDDDDWKEFLKTFTKPLDEVAKAAEDEEQDPEYNVLADEEIDEVDTEELRADRAVTVSRKELNCLIAELFEYADICASTKANEKNNVNESVEAGELKKEKSYESDLEDGPNISIKRVQIPILAQQMRQHVQMLTQNFLLTYEHPELSDIAFKFKAMLNELNTRSEKRSNASMFHVANLPSAMKLIKDWEHLFETKDEKALECRKYMEKVFNETLAAKRAGTDYIPTFPPFLMETIANSNVFIYTNLLPRIPFKPLQTVTSPLRFFTQGEDNLIALFLEQHLPTLKRDVAHLTKQKTVNMEHAAFFISSILMPNTRPSKIARHIKTQKSFKCDGNNPIKYFYVNKKVPPFVHYVVPLEDEMLSPRQRTPEVLPHLWREFLFPIKDNFENNKNIGDSPTINNNTIIYIVSPVVYVSPNISVNIPTQPGLKPILPRKLVHNTPNTAQKKQEGQTGATKFATAKPVEKENPTLVGQNKNLTKMLPDMPSLGSTPMKNCESQNEEDVDNAKQKGDGPETSTPKKSQSLSFKDIDSFRIEFSKPDTVSQVKRNFENLPDFANSSTNSEATNTEQKDNPEDIHELMIASSTVKSVPKKEPSGAEKKRAKVRREFVSNLTMATPDDLTTQHQKEEHFAESFFFKLKQTLTVDDYEKMLEILCHYDEKTGNFVDLFTNIQSILLPHYKDLSEQFYLFLTDFQAHTVGKLMPYLMMKDMDRFVKKLQAFFKDQPSQMKKIIKTLTDLSENPEVTIDIIKATLLPLFKGNAALTDWFLQIFPSEKTPDMLATGPHERIDIYKELTRPPDEDICETVVLPDTEDPYGGLSCICLCHNVDHPQFKARSLHCKKCGLKFIQGKVYVQTGKGLRPAIVSFLTNPEKDHMKRLIATQRKRSDSSPSKQGTSPTKEGHPDEPRHSNESEDEEGKKKKTKTKRVRKIKDDTKGEGSKKSAKNDSSKTKSSPKRQSRKRTSTKKSCEFKPGATPKQLKRLAEQETDTEPPDQTQTKVGENSAESESAIEYFESSQDVTNTEDSEDSCGRNLSASQGETSWTKEEDKIILQAFRQSKDDERTFKQIADVLENRSVTDIKNRFHKLMSLLQQMTAKT